MLHGKVLRSPYPHAYLREIDATAAEALPGVKSVLTCKKLPDWKTGIPRHVRVLDRNVRYVGDAVALVAAETEEQAWEALERIQVTYEKLPSVYDVEEAIQPQAPQLYEAFPRNLVPLDVKVFGPKSLS
jgi:xanthine dehydrogenase molybdenum-binding subunit